MDVSLRTVEDFAQFLRELLARVHVRRDQDVGALFSFAYALSPAEEPQFLTGRCIFEHPQVPSRRDEYPQLLLEEFWLAREDAITALFEAARGKATFDGKRLPSFGVPHARRQLAARPSFTGWPEWVFYARANRGGGTTRYATQDPVVRPGYRPYSSGNQAIADWVWRLPTKDAPNELHHDELVVVVPDYRKRIKSADWRARKVVVEVDGSETDVEIQSLALSGGTHQPLPSESSLPTQHAVALEVPADTERIELFLVRKSGELADYVTLYTSGADFEAAAGEPTPEERAAVELRNGENHEVEFKPFVAPAEAKEEEIVRTVVAFSNSGGGRLYIGVRDGGVPEGEAALCRATKKDATAGSQVLADRARHLVREKVKPVPEIHVHQIRVFGEPVLVVEVPASSAGPFSTHENDVFVRKGATNRKPDPRTELPRIGRTVDAAIFGLDHLEGP